MLTLITLVQFSPSVVSSSLQHHGPQHAGQASLSITNSQSLLKLTSWSRWCHPTISSCCPLLLLPSVFPSLRVFSNESILHIRRQNYCNFIFSISPSNEISGLISFKIDWFDLLAVQGTLSSLLLQHHSSKVKALITSQRYSLSGFFTVVHHAHLLRVGKFYSRSSRVEFLHKLFRIPLCTEFDVFFSTYYLLNNLYP